MMFRRDIIVGLVVLAGLLPLYMTLSSIDPEATIFIRVVMMVIGVLALLLMLQSTLLQHRSKVHAQASGKKAPEPGKPLFVWKPVILIFVTILIYFYVMEWLGFYVSAFLYFVAVVFLLDWRGLTPKTGLVRIASALVFVVVVYVLFNKILLVQTPRGLLM